MVMLIQIRKKNFLQVAAVAFNYRQSGIQPLHKETVNLPAAPAEEKRYCSAAAIQALKDIQSEESTPLAATMVATVRCKTTNCATRIITCIAGYRCAGKKIYKH